MTEDQHSRFEGNLVIIGDEAWFREEWDAERARREQARPRNKRYNAKRPRKADRDRLAVTARQ